MYNWNRPTQQQPKSHNGSLTCGVKAMVGKANWKTPKLPLHRKIINQKKYCIPRAIAEISASIKALKFVKVVIPTSSAFTSLIWPAQETDEI